MKFRLRPRKLKLKIMLYFSCVFLLIVSVFVLSQMVLAQNTSSFQIKDSYIEVKETDYPQNIALVQKENGKEKIAGQVKIVDQYLLSDIPENEFLDEYSGLKEGFQDLTLSLESDEPIFGKENFYSSSSLFEKTKSLLGFETLPEYRITKEVDKSQSVQTKLDLSTLTIETNYKKTGDGNIKQALIFKNNTSQDLSLNLALKHIINAEKIIWNKEEYEITQTPRSFNPEIESAVSFYPSDVPYLAVYDFSDTLNFDPQLWVFKEDSQNVVLLQLLVNVPANSSTIIDPWYGFVGDKKYAWGENVGWVNLYPTDGKVYVATDCLKGYAWLENVGWVNFGDGTPGAASDCDSGVHYANDSASDFGVNNDGSGNLYGYAWGENIGWVNFDSTDSQVVIDSSGNFSGYAWGENIGWIHFDHTQTSYIPQTEWAPPPSNTAPTASTISETSTSGSPTNVGSAVTFSGTISDPDTDDQVRLAICKTDEINASSQCTGGAWCYDPSSTEWQAEGAASCDYTALIGDASSNAWYAYACDDDNACTGMTEDDGTFYVNHVPAFTVVPDDSSTGASPTNAGSDVTFTATATDSDGDQYKLLVCKTDGTSGGDCDGGESDRWCVSSLTNSGSQASCAYTTTGSESCNGSNESCVWYAYACDEHNFCSANSNANSPFKINHRPSFTTISDAPDPVSPGSDITFSSTASDSDTDTVADTVKLVVCKTAGVADGACDGGAEDTWCASSLSASNPSCNYSALITDTPGVKNHYPYVFDNHNFGAATE